MRRRFFVERFDGATATLRGESATHLARVLRAQRDQLYELSDGEKVWLGRIERAGRGGVQFTLVEAVPAREPSLQVQLLLAIVKFDRFEWCLEKATELGVTEIVPLAAARSGKALLAAAAKRAHRWEKILLESAQQARRLRAPSLSPLGLPRAAFAGSRADVRILLSESREAPALRELLAELGPIAERAQHAAPPQNPRRGTASNPAAHDAPPSEAPAAPQAVSRRAARVALAIGPEGGWTDDEVALARSAGFREASLGANILRTETAVIAALAIFHYALGD
jgi:16S rRNA (uracil1498-N3)-methyltransferase